MSELPNSGIGVLIVGGAQGSLAVARSLGRRRIPVFCITHDTQLTRFSRYVTASVVWGGPDRPDAANELLELGRRHHLEGYVLIPGGDSEVHLISQHHAKLERTYKITTPEWNTARWALDKQLTYERCASLGIDHPWSRYPRDLADVVNTDFRFPVVLKPKIHSDNNAFTIAKAWRVNDRETLLARCTQALALVGGNGTVLQEMIPGNGTAQYSYAALWDSGQPVAALIARRTRQYPVEFGYSSTLVQTVTCDEVEQAAVRFLKSLDYSGLVEVEFKHDARDQRYKLLDVNIRSWTWISLAAVAGVDFPYMLWQLANGETVMRGRGRAGVTWVYFSRDLIAACLEVGRRRLSIMAYLKSFRGPKAFAVFAADDPMPSIVELPLLSWRLITRRLPLLLDEMQSLILKWLASADTRFSFGLRRPDSRLTQPSSGGARPNVKRSV